MVCFCAGSTGGCIELFFFEFVGKVGRGGAGAFEFVTCARFVLRDEGNFLGDEGCPFRGIIFIYIYTFQISLPLFFFFFFCFICAFILDNKVRAYY